MNASLFLCVLHATFGYYHVICLSTVTQLYCDKTAELGSRSVYRISQCLNFCLVNLTIKFEGHLELGDKIGWWNFSTCRRYISERGRDSRIRSQLINNTQEIMYGFSICTKVDT